MPKTLAVKLGHWREKEVQTRRHLQAKRLSEFDEQSTTRETSKTQGSLLSQACPLNCASDDYPLRNQFLQSSQHLFGMGPSSQLVENSQPAKLFSVHGQPPCEFATTHDRNQYLTSQSACNQTECVQSGQSLIQPSQTHISHLQFSEHPHTSVLKPSSTLQPTQPQILRYQRQTSQTSLREPCFS